MPTILLAAALACGGTPAISVTPATRAGQAPTVVVGGAKPGGLVRVEARRPNPWNGAQLFGSHATFRADRCGQARLSQAPVEGSWTGSDPRAFLWSMTNTGEASPAGLTSGEVRLSADVNGDGRADAKASLPMPSGPRVAEVPLGPTQPGAFLLHPAPGQRRPLIVLLGGSEGGDGFARASAGRLLTAGYAVLGLPYYTPGYAPGPKIAGLPDAFVDIPLDRLEAAIAWARARPDIGRVGVYGVSKGAEFALAAASRMDGIDAVAAIVPSDVIWEGWGMRTTPGATSSFSWRGEPLPFVPYKGMDEVLAKFARGERARIRDPHDAGRAANAERVAPARIAVERIAAPVLIAGGGKDETWASGDMAAAIGRTRAAVGLPTVTLIFPEAGHALSGTGDAPASAAEARAQSVVWAATLDLFERALKN